VQEGHVRLDPAALVAELSIDRVSGRVREIVRRDALKGSKGSRAADLELRE
jgi:hypothetical protein